MIMDYIDGIFGGIFRLSANALFLLSAQKRHGHIWQLWDNNFDFFFNKELYQIIF